MTMLSGFSALSLLLTLGAYLFGAIPFGLLLASYVAKIDVRASGSGNIGATNVARVAGKKLGALTLILDLLKGLTPVAIARALGVDELALAGVAIAAVIGHCFSVFLRFRGGKGVATGLGVFFAINPITAAAGALGYVLAFALTRISSLGSFSLLAGTIIASAVLAPPYWPLAAEAVIAIIIVSRHHENIRRLLGGSESKIS